MTANSRLRIALFSLALTFVGGAVSAQAVRSDTQPRPSKEYTIEQFLNTVAIAGASFSSDETRILVSSNKTGIWNVYSLAVTGGELVPVTASTTDSTYAVSYFPHDARILFTRDQSGNELTHLYVRTPDGQERDLTPGDKLKASFVRWTHDGAAFYVASNERDQRFFDLYRYDTKNYDRSLTSVWADVAGLVTRRSHDANIWCSSHLSGARCSNTDRLRHSVALALSAELLKRTSLMLRV